jgi:hypothetical protein
MPEKVGKVWVRKEFIKSWMEHSGAKDWERFYKLMNGSRVAFGCNPYKSSAGLSIQLGKISKALTDKGYKAPDYPERPTAKKKEPPKIEDEAAELGLTKI